MCAVCGCGQAEVVIEKGDDAGAQRDRRVHDDQHVHDHGDGRGPHSHPHPHHDHDHAGHDLAHGTGNAGATRIAGANETRMVQIERDILSKNDAFAATTGAPSRAAAARAEFRLEPRLGQDLSAGARRSSDLEGRARRSRSSKATSRRRTMPSASGRPARPQYRSTPARAAISTPIWSATRWRR